MCGRFYLKDIPVSSWDYLDINLPDDVSYSNYNIVPSQSIPIIRNFDGKNMLDDSMWGLAPKWARDKELKPMINARAETADSKPFFRSAFKKQRCIIPMSGFYEWKRDSGSKIPHSISLPDIDLFAVAGLYEMGEDGLPYRL